MVAEVWNNFKKYSFAQVKLISIFGYALFSKKIKHDEIKNKGRFA